MDFEEIEIMPNQPELLTPQIAKLQVGKPYVRCSELNQLLSCNGSREVIKRVAKRDDSGKPQTRSGNWCHWEAARILIETHGAICPAGLSATPPDPDYKPTSFDRWVVGYYIQNFLGLTEPGMAIEVENEMAYDIGPCYLSGHEDGLAINASATEAVNGDLKRGNNPVDPACTNWQILGYAALTKLAYPTLKKLTSAIIQPALIPDMGMDRVSIINIDEAELDLVVPFLASKITEAFANSRQLETGWKQCTYCPANLQCPALLAELEEMKLLLTDEALEQIKAQPDDSLLARWVLGRKLLTGRFDAANEILRERVFAAGGSLALPEGEFKTAPHFAPRKIETEKGWDRLCVLFDDEPDRAYKCMKLSASEIEEQLGSKFKLPATSKKQRTQKDEFNDRFGDITTREEGIKLIVVK